MARLPVVGPVVIPNTILVTAYWTCEGRTHRNTWHATRAGTTTVDGGLAQSLFTAISGALTSSGWLGFVDPTATFTAIGVKDLNAANLVEFLSTGAPVAGTGLPPALPAQVAIVVTNRTNQAGRAFRGRTYLGCLVDAAAANSYVATGPADVAAAAFVTAVRSAFTANNLTMAIGQRALQAGTDKKGNPLPPRAANSVPVTQNIIVNPRLDTQRRRLGR